MNKEKIKKYFCETNPVLNLNLSITEPEEINCFIDFNSMNWGNVIKDFNKCVVETNTYIKKMDSWLDCKINFLIKITNKEIKKNWDFYNLSSNYFEKKKNKNKNGVASFFKQQNIPGKVPFSSNYFGTNYCQESDLMERSVQCLIMPPWSPECLINPYVFKKEKNCQNEILKWGKEMGKWLEEMIKITKEYHSLKVERAVNKVKKIHNKL